MKHKQILTDLRTLFTDPKHWTQNVAARDQHGAPVAISSNKATCFCLLGGLIKIAEAKHTPADHSRAYAALHMVAGCAVMDFNDDRSTTHGDVLALIDRAIAS